MVNRQGDRAQNPQLVVGADSTIGRALGAVLETDGEIVLGTSRREGTPSLFLDLAAPATAWELPDRASVTTICAAMTRVGPVAGAEAQARRVNHEAVLELASTMAGRGSRVVFLSTAQVFDGREPFTPSDSPPRPISLYGQLKAETEAALSLAVPEAAVLRLSKVVDPDLALFQGWLAALEAGEAIEAFADAIFSPVALPLAIEAVIAIGHGEESGVFQLSARDQVSYAEVAARLAQGVGAPSEMVRPVPADLALWPGGPHATLDTRRLERLFGIAAPAALEAVDWFLAGYSKKMKPQSPL